MESNDVTQLLAGLVGGNDRVVDRLLPMVYDELKEIAHRKLAYERDGHTIKTTDLVHESYLKLVDQRQANWQSRAQFYAIAAIAMRRILGQYARARKAEKRGSGKPHLDIDDVKDFVGSMPIEKYADLDDALKRLEAFNERGCRVVEYRFFAGLKYEEISEVMGLSVITVRRAWAAARAWLYADLQSDRVGDRDGS